MKRVFAIALLAVAAMVIVGPWAWRRLRRAP